MLRLSSRIKWALSASNCNHFYKASVCRGEILSEKASLCPLSTKFCSLRRKQRARNKGNCTSEVHNFRFSITWSCYGKGSPKLRVNSYDFQVNTQDYRPECPNCAFPLYVVLHKQRRNTTRLFSRSQRTSILQYSLKKEQMIIYYIYEHVQYTMNICKYQTKNFEIQTEMHP